MTEKLHKYFYHWLIGDNPVRTDEPTYIVNLELGVSIRFNYQEAFYANYDDFYQGVADVQFLKGDRPDEQALTRILIDAYNFMAIVDRIEDDFGMEDINDSIFSEE